MTVLNWLLFDQPLYTTAKLIKLSNVSLRYILRTFNFNGIAPFYSRTPKLLIKCSRFSCVILFVLCTVQFTKHT